MFSKSLPCGAFVDCSQKRWRKIARSFTSSGSFLKQAAILLFLVSITSTFAHADDSIVMENHAVFSDGADQIYQISADGLLLSRKIKYVDPTRAVQISNCSDFVGRQRRMMTRAGTGRGWKDYKFVFSSGDGEGVIYVVRQDGRLGWYRITGYVDGKALWANDGREKIVGTGSGWADYKKIFSNGDGTIYAVKADGSLVWYRHLGYLSGDQRWANNGRAITVSLPGHNWLALAALTGVGGGGRIVGLSPDGRTLYAYKHEGRLDGRAIWTRTTGVQTLLGFPQSIIHLFGGVDNDETKSRLYYVNNEGVLYAGDFVALGVRNYPGCEVGGGFHNAAHLN